MINRDFAKSGKQYVNKNKFVLIAIGLILALGVIILCAFGFKGGTEIEGYKREIKHLTQKISEHEIIINRLIYHFISNNFKFFLKFFIFP